MKKLLISVALLASPMLALAGISINIGEPDYYGQLQPGNERPQLLYVDPIIIQRGPGRYPPLYLRVPEYQARNWGAYCARYGACGRPVYFVNDHWYRNTYAPRYRHDHRHDYRHDYGHNYRHDYGRNYDRHDNGHHYRHERRDHGNRGYPADRGVPANRGVPAERTVPADKRGAPDNHLNRFYDAR